MHMHIDICLRFAAAETVHETVWVVRETKLKHVFVWP